MAKRLVLVALVVAGAYILGVAPGERGAAAADSPFGIIRSEDLDAIRARGKLVVLTRNAPTTYYEAREGNLEGVEYELTRAFAQELGVAVEYEFFDGVPRVLDALARREGHVAAAGVTLTPLRAERFAFGAPYQTVQQEVVCGPGVRLAKLKSAADLHAVALVVPSETSYDQRLKKMSAELPGLKWQATPDLYTEQLLQAVAEDEVDCTVADSNLVAVHQRYYLGIRKAFALGAPENLAWAVNHDQPALRAAIDAFMARIEASGELESLIEKYYGHIDEFDPYDTRVFVERVKTRLPKYRRWFQQAGLKYDLPWTLLAAVAYQESQWDPKAKSPTGVRGMMMLTEATARAMGVKNRLDPRQSIFGGARYLRSLLDRMPAYIDADARLWMALASYNVGYYHLRDARALSVQLEKNPSSWSDVEKVLPLLAQQKYFKRLAHGYARGYEPVLYVKRVRNYRELLKPHAAGQ